MLTDESGATPSEPSCTYGESRRVHSKRKASCQLESPTKRSTRASQTTQVVVEGDTVAGINRKVPKVKASGQRVEVGISREPRARICKRKASPEVETRHKKPRSESRTTGDGSTTKTSVTGLRQSRINNTSRAAFNAKYLQLNMLGEGGFGSVYAGCRKSDHLPVAIKHVPKSTVKHIPGVSGGNLSLIPLEAFLMMHVAGGPQSLGKSAAVSLLDWYEVDQEVLLVMERPVPSVDLLTFINEADKSLSEDLVKDIMKQLVNAALDMQRKKVFHRDLKTENVLIETGSDVLRVRIIDFGCGCFAKRTVYSCFYGTSEHAPPEYFRNGTYRAGPTTAWQLGVLLYEMLEGQFSTSEFINKEIQVSRQLSKDCQHLLDLCLAMNPKDRGTLRQIQRHPWLS